MFIENNKKKGQIDNFTRVIIGIIVLILFFSLSSVFFGSSGLGAGLEGVPLWLVPFLIFALCLGIVRLIRK